MSLDDSLAIGLNEFLETQYGFRSDIPIDSQTMAYEGLEQQVCEIAHDVAILNGQRVRSLDAFFFEHFAAKVDAHEDGHLNYAEAFDAVYKGLQEGPGNPIYDSAFTEWEDEMAKCKYFLCENYPKSVSRDRVIRELHFDNIIGNVLFKEVVAAIKRVNPTDEEGTYELPTIEEVYRVA